MSETKTGTLSALDPDQVDHARDLVAGALQRASMKKRELRAAIATGYGAVVLHKGEHPSLWPSDTPLDRARCAAGRLLIRLSNELFLPMESIQGPSAQTIASELLEE